jgi:putative phosphoesterase
VKIVIVSDLHANLEALSSLPEEYDELWVLGDLMNYGPDPGEVVDFVQTKASVVVRGNHDQAIGFGDDPRCSAPFREMAKAMKLYTDSVLSDSQKQFLRELPLRAVREVAGVRVTLCHAVPSNPLYAYCLPYSALWEQEIDLADSDILLVGHTHIPFVRKFGQRVVANPGSLGQPKTGSPAACYAVWEGGPVDLRSFHYPVEETIRKIEALPVPDQVQWSLTAVLRQGGSAVSTSLELPIE